ncbi:MAG: hypothetical protein LBE31_01620 [Deltaproteobacteria bacterium]|jgi:cell fate regulator YaaT (PSP1 superfamily)|nr:hypothetical protein [Deltaproteobacteria bacterium]
MAPDTVKHPDKPFKSKNPDYSRRGLKVKHDDTPKVNDLPCRRTVNVRMRYGGRIMTYDCGEHELDIGDWVVIKDADILRMGLVCSKPIIWPADQEKRQVCLPSDRRLLRVASDSDLARQAENQLKEREAFEYCQGCIANQNLMMKLVAVEITFDNFKTIFYYTADDRVDFRQLVKELVSRLRARIEMRQIGVRNEALMLGGVGICGRPFCCAGFLTSFSPVSVKMAKEQNISLNTTKLSGVCGRLMCCLAFENYSDQTITQDDDDSALSDEPQTIRAQVKPQNRETPLRSSNGRDGKEKREPKQPIGLLKEQLPTQGAEVGQSAFSEASEEAPVISSSCQDAIAPEPPKQSPPQLDLPLGPDQFEILIDAMTQATTPPSWCQLLCRQRQLEQQDQQNQNLQSGVSPADLSQSQKPAPDSSQELKPDQAGAILPTYKFELSHGGSYVTLDDESDDLEKIPKNIDEKIDAPESVASEHHGSSFDSPAPPEPDLIGTDELANFLNQAAEIAWSTADSVVTDLPSALSRSEWVEGRDYTLEEDDAESATQMESDTPKADSNTPCAENEGSKNEMASSEPGPIVPPPETTQIPPAEGSN